MNSLKIFINKKIEQFSEYQLPGLICIEPTLEEKNKRNESYCKSFYIIPPKKTDLYKKEIELFSNYTNKYKKVYYSDRYKYISDKEYEDYIDFINNTALRCNDICSYKVCPWCKYCKVDHQKDRCGEEKMNMIKKKYGTWRRYFSGYNKESMDYSIVYKHEQAIYRNYYEYISNALYAKKCPCQIVLYDNNISKSDIIRKLKFEDSRFLELNIIKINNVLGK